MAQREHGGAAIALKDLAGETFIVYARQLGPAFYEATMAACLKAGFTPRLGQEAPRITSALSLVAVGLGITLVPACMQRMTMDGIAYRGLKGASQPKAVLNLASRRGEPSPSSTWCGEPQGIFPSSRKRMARSKCPVRSVSDIRMGRREVRSASERWCNRPAQLVDS
jgi:LysR substrate binding domain